MPTTTNPTDLDSEIDVMLNSVKSKEPVQRNEETGVTIYKVIELTDDAKTELKSKVKAIIARECDKARIDELKRMQYTDAEQGLAENFAWMAYLSERVAQLKAEAAQKDKS